MEPEQKPPQEVRADWIKELLTGVRTSRVVETVVDGERYAAIGLALTKRANARIAMALVVEQLRMFRTAFHSADQAIYPLVMTAFPTIDLQQKAASALETLEKMGGISAAIGLVVQQQAHLMEIEFQTKAIEALGVVE